MTRDAKTKLLDSAFSEFAQNGFFGAKTRDIARKADANISSILYYFGGKKGIYAAALKNIVETVKEKTADADGRYEAVMQSGHAAEAKGLLKEIVRRFLFLLCDESVSKDMKTVFLSEYAHPTDEFGILYEGLIRPFHEKMARLLAQASGGRISLQEGYLYTFPLFSQLFVFSSRKETICRFMAWDGYRDAEKEKLLDYIWKQIDFLVENYK